MPHLGPLLPEHPARGLTLRKVNLSLARSIVYIVGNIRIQTLQSNLTDQNLVDLARASLDKAVSNWSNSVQIKRVKQLIWKSDLLC
jgi:predicted RNA binding protein with dsRBD fold (UPF0201 family)